MGAVGFTLKNSKLENVGRGVFTDWGGARDFYIADGYTGNAPDLGALEFGKPLPIYGPRPLANQP